MAGLSEVCGYLAFEGIGSRAVVVVVDFLFSSCDMLLDIFFNQ